MARTPRPRVAGVERLLHIPRRGRVPLDVAALSHSNELLLLIGLVVEDQTVPYAPPLGRRGASGEHERDEQREEQQPSTLHTNSKSQRQAPVAWTRPGSVLLRFRSRLAGQVARQLFTRSRFILCMTRFT